VTAVDDITAGAPIFETLSASPSDTNSRFMVNNWLGWLSTCSCPCPDTNDLNLVEIEITFDSEKILWGSHTATAGSAPVSTGAGYTLSDILFTISKIGFTDPLYYNLKASKLLSSGLSLGYQTYVTSKQAVFTKGTSVNVLTTVNSTSLDQLICVLQPGVPNISALQLFGSNNLANAIQTYNQVAASGYVGQSGATDANAVTAGDLFNQSYYFKSDTTGLLASSIEINNTPLMPQPLDDAQVYNETLIARGFNRKSLSCLGKS